MLLNCDIYRELYDTAESSAWHIECPGLEWHSMVACDEGVVV